MSLYWNNHTIVIKEEVWNRADNLWWGTQKENIQDCHKKGRAKNNLPKLYK